MTPHKKLIGQKACPILVSVSWLIKAIGPAVGLSNGPSGECIKHECGWRNTKTKGCAMALRSVNHDRLN